MLRSGRAGALNVLIVEDDDAVRGACAGMAESLGYRVRTAGSVPEARALLAESVDVVFLDMKLPGGTGTGLMEEIRSAHPRAFIVVMTAYATVSTAVDLMRNGAGDFLQKPFALTQVATLLEAASERTVGAHTSRALGDRLQAGLGAGRLIGASEAMQKLFRIVAKVALTRHPVLILGEHGTGKEIVAGAIHANGPNPASPFVPVDCDALEPQRLEAELFGAEASPGRSARPGLLAGAGEGTVFLAEIDCLPPAAQARLVRALAERRIHVPGRPEPAPLQSRIIASSSRNLETMVEQGRFRKDLFYRLNVVSLRVPPLRERLNDIPLLAEHFLERQRREHNTHFVLSDEAMDALLSYTWAGNVGELESLIERACGLSSNALLHLGDMSTQIRNFVQTSAAADDPDIPTTESPLIPIHELERKAIQSAMQQLRGDKILVAKCLGIGKTTLYRKLKEYGIADDAA
ncbi:MAG TPA: sigma-54 dependent transcriptional regulator [Acidobacteriaceae bacterium]|nr:sigma-54 dependent transcriptional regulator [Acidobacteriaceae bacterium]